MALNKKQKTFCEEYVMDFNATKAAIRAGYSEATAYSIGHRLKNNPDCEKYIQQLIDQRQDKLDATEAEFVREVKKIAYGAFKDNDRLNAWKTIAEYKGWLNKDKNINIQGNITTKNLNFEDLSDEELEEAIKNLEE